MATAPEAADRRRRQSGGWQVMAGLGAGVLVLLVLVVPVVVMLLLAPRGFPTRLPDALAFVLLAAAGAVVGLVARAARSRLAQAVVVAGLLTLLALWFQRGTWYSPAWLPAPPILPNVPPTLVLAAGVFLATAVVAASDARRHRPVGSTSTYTVDRSRTTPAVVLGAVAAAAVVGAVEGDVWGRRQLQQTFQGPWGLSLFRWLAVLFVALLVVGALLGWVAAARYTPVAPTVAAVGLAATVALIWIVAGLDGPPRSTLYGLTFGLLAITALTSRPTRPGA